MCINTEGDLLIRLVLIILPLYIGTLPIALYISFAGGSVSVPLGHWGLEIHRLHQGGRYVEYTIRKGQVFGLAVGPDLDARGYENTLTADYPLLPLSIKFYRRNSEDGGK